jgi:integrase
MTGLRIGEILALTWDDLDVENKTIRVNKQVQRIDGELTVNTPKTASSIRTLSICEDCVNDRMVDLEDELYEERAYLRRRYKEVGY